MNKPTVVIDTNLFVSAVIRKGLPDKLLKQWHEGTFNLIISEELIDEVEDVLNRDWILSKYSISQQEIQKVLTGLKSNAINILQINIDDLPIHGRDPEDDFLLACALGGDADYLITGDKDLLVLDGNPALGKLKIVTVEEFLKHL